MDDVEPQDEGGQEQGAAPTGPRRQVTYRDLEYMTMVLALDLGADPATWGWAEEPHLSEWHILREQIRELKAQGIGIDIPFS